MATLSKGYTFGATETVTNTKLHNLVDLGSVSDIVNADVSATADIDATKLNLASAGYLTTGGNFDVTGRYSFSNLSWANIGSLASINTAWIQNLNITSLMSVASANISDMTIQTVVLSSLVSISQLNVSGAVLFASLASIGQLDVSGAANFTSMQGDYLLLDEQGSAPATAANQAALYTKETGGQSELYYREESSGDEVQLTNAGSPGSVAGTQSFAAYCNTNFNGPQGSNSAVAFTDTTKITEEFDIGNNHNGQGTYTIPVTGKYLFGATLELDKTSGGASGWVLLWIYVNGAQHKQIARSWYDDATNTDRFALSGCALINVSATNTVTFVTQNASDTNNNWRYYASSTLTHIWGYRIS